MNLPKPQRHIPVLVPEVLHYLDPGRDKVYLDVTFGAGGHTRALLEHEPTCRVYALDWDQSAIEYSSELRDLFGERLEVIWGNFAHIKQIAKKWKLPLFDGILADFGVSTIQIKEAAGFSFMEDTVLDMRMSPAHQIVTASQVINEASEEELRDIIWHLGQERFAKTIARAIVMQRKRQPIVTTRHFAQVIETVVPRHGPLHPATKTFQAIRIYVNKELDNIASFLAAVPSLLVPGGRLVCITFHSLEDRMVKQFFTTQEEAGRFEILTHKVVKPSMEEIEANRSARSAKLRAGKLIFC